MGSKEVAVSVKNIHKDFILPQSKNTSLKQVAVNIVRQNNKVTQKVLDNVSFDIHKGDFFGIVGRNGSGKSTLLKLIAGVYTPTGGSVEVNGGLTPFIELGVGFNPELSGRDNVYLNGALLGFTRKQMDEMYNEIVDFAELGPFMDQKLKNYSSGMQVRLAFSIAIKAKNDILIFDEVLAVGDEAFQRKCLDVFERYKAEKQTVILVSHDMETVKQYCNKAVLIHEGKILTQGDPAQIAFKYSALNQENVDAAIETKEEINDSVIYGKLSTIGGKAKRSFRIGEPIRLDIDWAERSGVEVLMIDLFRLSGEHVSGFKSLRDGIEIGLSQRAATVVIDNLLSPGKYRFMVSLRNKKDEDISINTEVAEFTIINDWSHQKESWSGMMPISHHWLSS